MNYQKKEHKMIGSPDVAMKGRMECRRTGKKSISNRTLEINDDVHIIIPGLGIAMAVRSWQIHITALPASLLSTSSVFRVK